MVSDNNNINSLAAEAADETTSELEILSIDLIPTDDELEMDANTFSLDEDDDDGHVADLQSDLRSKDERISSLQFDIEQLRARWTGLEKEISAREELTDILQADLKAAHKNLAAKEKELSRKTRSQDKLTARIDNEISARTAAERQLADFEHQIDVLSKTEVRNGKKIEELQAEIAAVESQPIQSDRDELIAKSQLAVAELNAYIDGRKTDWHRQITEIEVLTAANAEKDEFRNDLESKLTATQSNFDSADCERERLASLLKQSRAQIETLRADIRDRQQQLDDYENNERAADKQLIAEHEGTIATLRAKHGLLESRVAQAEKYADELRHKLSNTLEQSDSYSENHEVLSERLAAAREENSEIVNQLEFEQDRATTLQTLVDEQQRAAEEEINVLNAELAEASNAVQEQQSLNEQLASDLIDNQVFKQALEDQLNASDDAHESKLKDLRKKARKLENAVEELEQKISNKDNAISALLNELANKSKTIESIDVIESVIHEIDDRMSERIDDRSIGDRDRQTRLLVGEIEGQELRFPLFKNRLTIGRTVQNDIQLRAQFISRRHAVIVTDEEGTKIVDWGSKNGVYVNNARISEQILRSGDSVMIGNAEFVYEELAKRPTG